MAELPEQCQHRPSLLNNQLPMLLSLMTASETDDRQATDAAVGHNRHTDQLSSCTEHQVLFNIINNTIQYTLHNKFISRRREAQIVF